MLSTYYSKELTKIKQQESNKKIKVVKPEILNDLSWTGTKTELVELYSSNFSTNSNFNKDWKNIKASLKQNEVAIEFVSYKSSVDPKYIAYVVKTNSQFPEVVKLYLFHMKL